LLELIVERDKDEWLHAVLEQFDRDFILNKWMNASNQSLFYSACASGKHRIVKYLLSNRLISAQAVNTDGPYPGETPIYLAMYSAHVEVVRLLLPFRPDLRRPTTEGHRAIDMLSLRNSKPMWELFHFYAFLLKAKLIMAGHMKNKRESLLAILPRSVILRILRMVRTRHPQKLPTLF